MFSSNTSVMAKREYLGVVCDGRIELVEQVDLPEGCKVLVKPIEAETPGWKDLGKVIIAGYGLAGRWVADIFHRHGIGYTIIEKNADTVRTQRELGHQIVLGDVADEKTLRRAGIEEASILALTVPDEEAVLLAIETAKHIKPDIYIVARTTYSSKGMEASQLGADAVIKAEQAVARQFYEMLQDKLRDENEASGPE